MASTLFIKWLQVANPTAPDVPLYNERDGAREFGLSELKTLLAAHFVGEETVLKMGGYVKAARTIRNSLPTSKRTQSGDLGELIATEYVDTMTKFHVPVRKLRWKSDRQMPMHGNDVIAIQMDGKRTRVLKGEAKSRKRFDAGTVSEAVQSLNRNDGHPNPSTVAFIVKRLYEENRDDEARIFENLQIEGTLSAKDVQHLIFCLAGADPSQHLTAAAKPENSSIKRIVAAVVISDHAALVEAVYASYGA